MATLFFLLFTSVAAQSNRSNPPAPGPNGSMGRPHEATCKDGYGIFKCVDPINCATLTGEVSCCKTSREIVASMLGKDKCGSAQNNLRRGEKQGGTPILLQQTCLTSMACAPSGAHYMTIIPASKFLHQSSAFAVATLATAATDSTSGDSPKVTTAATAVATTTPLPLPMAASSQPPLKPEDHKPLKGSAIGGTVVGILAGGSLLLLVLYLSLRHWKDRKDNHNPKLRGVLADPRLPTGSTVPGSAYRGGGSGRDNPSVGSDRYSMTNGTLSAGHTERPFSYGNSTVVSSSQPQYHAYSPDTSLKRDGRHPIGDLEANVEQQDVGLQYYSESIYSQTTGVPSPQKAAKDCSSDDGNDNVSSPASPAQEPQAPLFGTWPAENDGSTFHRRNSSASANWPLSKSTVSSPALLQHGQQPAQRPPAISPLSPLSPIGDSDFVKEEADKERAEKEQHRKDAYKKLSGEMPDVELTKKPGSVARARQNMGAAYRAKEPGSVSRARQNVFDIRDFLRELNLQSGDEADLEANETGTVIRRKGKRAH